MTSGDETARPELQGRPPLVLIAEDDPLASMALRAQLEALEFRVLGPARDGHEAIALGACFPVDIALFDVRMPGRSGLEAAAELFRLAPTPVVLLTGVAAADLPDPLPRPPIFASLAKPVGLAELGRGLHGALDGFRQWADGEGDLDLDRLAERRRTIARAVDAGDGRDAEAATTLLQRARREQRPLLDVARAILEETPS